MYTKVLKPDDQLLAECDVDMFRSSGPGGQNVNRRETAIRLHHRPTGIVVTCQNERSQFRNKQLALEQLRSNLAKMYRKRKKRLPTSMPKAVKEKILKQKREKSQKKALRSKPGIKDE